MSIKKPLTWLLTLATFFFMGSAYAFTPIIHGHDICTYGLLNVKRVIEGEPLEFKEKARVQICREDYNTDNTRTFFQSAVHFDSEDFPGGTNRLINLKNEVINLLTRTTPDGVPVPDGSSARTNLGGALHTLQDFYAHSNWVEMGKTAIETRLGDEIIERPSRERSFCTDNEHLDGFGLTELTSGYWVGALGCGIWIADGKCYHGYVVGNCDGINKDDPSRPNYERARDLAIGATTDFVHRLFNDIPPEFEHYARAVKALMGINGTLGMVIDTTGSMTDEINWVKKTVAGIVNGLKDTGNEPDEYLLEPFGDPSWGPPVKSTDPDDYLSAVNSLGAIGGGDCPEYSLHALHEAVAASRNDSILYFFSDADAKDPDMAGKAYDLARKKRIIITKLLTGVCSPESKSSDHDGQSTAKQKVRADKKGSNVATLSNHIDPAYISIVEATGGQLFLLDAKDLGQSLEQLITPQLSGDFVTITRINGNLDEGPKNLIIPVDSTITKLFISISSMGTIDPVTLTRPSGAKVTLGDPGVKFTNISSGIFMTIDNPESGKWRVSISGSGKFNIAAKANSPLDLYIFEFVEKITLRGWDSYAPISGQPTTGASATGKATLIGPFKTAMFHLVDDAGNIVQAIDFSPELPGAPSSPFVGPITLPNTPFRIAVSGVDANGTEYERLFSNLFQAQSVEVIIDPTTNFLELPSGATTTFKFNVHNLGDAGTFQIAAADNLGFAQPPNPNQLTLGTGETKSFQVDVAVPAGVANGASLSLTVTATSATNPDLANSAVVTATVTATSPGDLNKDGKVDLADYLIFLNAFGTCNGSPDYNPDADYDSDGCVTFVDYQRWYQFYLNP